MATRVSAAASINLTGSNPLAEDAASCQFNCMQRIIQWLRSDETPLILKIGAIAATSIAIVGTGWLLGHVIIVSAAIATPILIWGTVECCTSAYREEAADPSPVRSAITNQRAELESQLVNIEALRTQRMTEYEAQLADIEAQRAQHRAEHEALIADLEAQHTQLRVDNEARRAARRETFERESRARLAELERVTRAITEIRTINEAMLRIEAIESNEEARQQNQARAYRLMQDAVGGADAFSQYPILDLNGQSIASFETLRNLTHSVMKGTDAEGNPFICLKVRRRTASGTDPNSREFTVVFFQVRPTSGLWSYRISAGSDSVRAFNTVIEDADRSIIRQVVVTHDHPELVLV